MAVYRSSSAPKPTVTLLVRGRRTLLGTVMVCVIASVPALFLNFVTVDCTRTRANDGRCQVRERGLAKWTVHDYPLRDLLAIRADGATNSDGDRTSHLVLETMQGDVALGAADSVNSGSRQDLATRYAAFRSGTAPSFHGTTGRGGLGFVASWLAISGFFLFALHRRTMRAEIDPARRVVGVRHWFRTVELPLSPDVRVVSGTDSEGDEAWFLTSGDQRVKLPQAPRTEDLSAFHAAIEDACSRE